MIERKVLLGTILGATLLAGGFFIHAAFIAPHSVLSNTTSIQQSTLNDLLPSADAASVDFFLKIDGVDGESSDDRHKGEIEVHSFSWGASNSGAFSYGSGASSGKVTISSFNFMKTVDKASPQLFTKAATGEHIEEVRLAGVMEGANPTEYYIITMQDAVISSYKQYTSADGTPTESVYFTFGKIQIEYHPMNPDGSAGEAIKAGYDVKSATKI